MAKANRTSWEREGYFDHAWGNGLVFLPRYKFVYLGDQEHWCPAALKTWLDHWREYANDLNADLEVLNVGEEVVLWLADRQRVGPEALSQVLARSS